MGKWRLLGAVALFACVSVVLRPTTADTTPLSVSIPAWAVELNAAQVVVEAPLTTLQQGHNDESLHQWASRRGHIEPIHATKTTDVFLLVGAKTSVVHGFARRQAIRQTWASAAFVPRGVKVVFLGCESDLSIHSSLKQQQLRVAIAHEKRVYGDLLTNELRNCVDSFAGLSYKVKAFMHWAATTHSSVAYAMVIDDDIYLRLDRLLKLLRRASTPRTRVFAGNSATSEYRGLAAPMRDPRHKYFIPVALYPMETLPPFLTGAHFILSGDIVHFVSKNSLDLRGLGGIDDATIGLWLFGLLQIQPTYLDEFQVLRMTKACSDDAISLADLTVSATRFLHENIANGRRLCDYFENAQRLKTARAIVAAPPTTTGDHQGDEPCFLHWDFQHDGATNRLQIAILLTVGSVAVDFVYVPSATTAEDGFCGVAASLLHGKLYLTVDQELCAYHSRLLLRALDRDALAKPAFGPLLAIARHNLRWLQLHEQIDNAASAISEETRTTYTPVERLVLTAVLSATANSVRVVVECLLVEVYPNHQVLVLNEGEAALARTPVNVYVVSTLDGPNAVETALTLATIVLLVEAPLSPVFPSASSDPRVVVLTAQLDNPSQHAKTLVILPASRVFGSTIQFTPTQLLQSQVDPADATQSRVGGLIYMEHQVGQAGISEFLSTVQETVPVQRIPSLAGCGGGSPDQDGLCLDQAVQWLRVASFVIVSHPYGVLSRHPDHVSDQFAIAFLAGAIPIYVGRSPAQKSRSRLFNPRAFIDCGAVGSIRDCTALVSAVYASPALYAEMRREAPITDRRIFENVFSWHPEVSRTMATTGEAVRLSERLRELLEGCALDRA